ncbi:hypothetical protein [uncultured Sphaerotilus sp.]|uniref:hypothetical protein n=1 Tax=uncultured Sphaerotilus sp. TaxID=474984 RepID=UPI0030CA2B8C
MRWRHTGAALNYTRFSSVNLDVKKVQIRTDLKTTTGTLGTLKIDPLLVGVGVGYKF